MTGTQSVVLGKTLAIIIRNYAAGKIVIFQPLDLFILVFILIVFLSFLITFAFWLYRRTESMVLFDTVFIAPMNQVMWLTFSTVAGGIYFHEFENANTVQWIGLFAGMMFNYLGLYYLVPTAADKPILIINMEKPQKNNLNMNIKKKYEKIEKTLKDKVNINKIYIQYKNKYKSNDDIIDNDKEHETDDEQEEHIKNMKEEDNAKNIRIEIEEELDDEERPLLNKSKSSSSSTININNNNNSNNKWYQFFAAKRRQS